MLNLTNQSSAGFNYRSSGRRSPMMILMTITRTLVNTLNNFIWLLVASNDRVMLRAVAVARVSKAQGPQRGPSTLPPSSSSLSHLPAKKKKNKDKKYIGSDSHWIRLVICGVFREFFSHLILEEIIIRYTHFLLYTNFHRSYKFLAL